MRSRSIISFAIAAFLLVAGLGVAFLFLRTPSLPAKALEARYVDSASQFLSLKSGARVHIRAFGAPTSPAIILLHGSNDSAFTWDGWAPILSKTYRVIAVDLPGHGLTGPDPLARYSRPQMAQFVEEVRQTLKLDQIAIGGNSMGGGVAWTYAALFPDRVNALILVDAAGAPISLSAEEKRNIPAGFALARIPVLRNLLPFITPRSLVRQGLLRSFSDASKVTDARVDLYWSLLRRQGNRAASLQRFSQNEAGINVREVLRGVHTPTLILWGEDDHVIPVRAADFFSDALAQSSVILYPKTGHLPQSEIPERSATDVLAFLNRWRANEIEDPAQIETTGSEP